MPFRSIVCFFRDSQLKALKLVPVLAVLFACAGCTASASDVHAVHAAQKASLSSCQVAEPDADSSTDVHALGDYSSFIR